MIATTTTAISIPVSAGAATGTGTGSRALRACAVPVARDARVPTLLIRLRLVGRLFDGLARGLDVLAGAFDGVASGKQQHGREQREA
jgi:hypothetical protein